ncbi:pentapeptide repeat-containing protein [Rivularia sp. UHCC 0363]|uniref:pentapeptide repeat-containing protein n=1 Tax=Rivularia sp. UHCC 0363 TaxID=3110244 RepID=UPI002B202283|nr:pentapeptide repeat-containing protein [Rivularia sp. UHCC 0363]MEA5599003.1 pentapeptide repeat-containing protein [Rivularia sp. UHCC 0363]
MDSHEKEVFPSLVRDIRKKINLSQREFGKLFDPPVKQQSVASWERGLTVPDRKYWSKLAELLDMEVGRFYEYVGTNITSPASVLEDIALKIRSLGASELNSINELIAQQWTNLEKEPPTADKTHLRILRKGAATWNQWREKHPEIKPNLRSVDLSEINYIDLSQYNLASADLTNIKGFATNFYQTNLVGANLSGAKLQNANFWKADMRACNLSNAAILNSHLIEAILNEANLSNAVLTDSNLSQASLIKANLSNANLTGADLSDVNLRQAMVEGAVFVNCNVAGISLWDVDLTRIKQGNLDVSALNKNGIKQDDLAWALFCNLRHQQPELFETENLKKFLDEEQEVIRIASEIVEKFGGESPGGNSRLYIKMRENTSYKIYQNLDLLEVTVSDEDRFAVILRVNNGCIDSNIKPNDIKNLKALLELEKNKSR